MEPEQTLGEMVGISLEPERMFPQPDFSNFSFPEKSDATLNHEESPTNDHPEGIIQTPDRKPVALKFGQVTNKLPANQDLPDTFYEQTRKDAILKYKHAKAANAFGDKPLLTEKLRRAREKPKATKTETKIRVILPNQKILQGIFNENEPISAVADFLRSNLTTETQQTNFSLFITPPKTLLKANKSLKEYRLTPAANIRVACEPSDQLLDLKDEIQELKPLQDNAENAQLAQAAQPLEGLSQEEIDAKAEALKRKKAKLQANLMKHLMGNKK